MTTVLSARSRGFVSTPAVDRLTRRSLRYLQSGYSVHLRGTAGIGKTTLALHLADLLGRPIMLIFGDDELKTSDMIGSQSGYTRRQVVDNYIHSVIKMEDELRQNWVDSRLTLAAKEGFTLVYDEFNRSRPEVNNVLLSVLEEKLLVLPPNHHRSEYVRVHPQFRMILTSNPLEYCGVHATQDALLDRLVTINFPEPDQLTQLEILAQRIGITAEEANLIINLVNGFRAKAGIDKSLGLRASLTIAKVCHDHEIPIRPDDFDFRDICADLLVSRCTLNPEAATKLLWELLEAQVVPESASSYAQPAIEFTSEAIADSQLEEELVAEPKISLEQQIYSYLQQTQGARLSEIETATGLNRVETVNTLRSLMQKGAIRLNDDRVYVVQEVNSL